MVQHNNNQELQAVPEDRYNEKMIDNIRSISPDGDGDALVRQVIAIFLCDAPTIIASIQAAAIANDLSKMHMHAHSLKSPCLQLGLMEMVRLCQAIENGEDATDASNAAVAELDASYAAAVQYLNRVQG